jgi:hypothetical protein
MVSPWGCIFASMILPRGAFGAASAAEAPEPPPCPRSPVSGAASGRGVYHGRKREAVPLGRTARKGGGT